MLEFDIIGRLVTRIDDDIYVAKKLHRADIAEIENHSTFIYADGTKETAKLTDTNSVVLAGGQTIQLYKVDDINFGESIKHKKITYLPNYLMKGTYTIINLKLFYFSEDDARWLIVIDNVCYTLDKMATVLKRATIYNMTNPPNMNPFPIVDVRDVKILDNGAIIVYYANYETKKMDYAIFGNIWASKNEDYTFRVGYNIDRHYPIVVNTHNSSVVRLMINPKTGEKIFENCAGELYPERDPNGDVYGVHGRITEDFKVPELDFNHYKEQEYVNLLHSIESSKK